MHAVSSSRLHAAQPEHMIYHMVQVLVQLDEETLRRLEEVAPGRSRKRSEFIRQAVQRALAEEQERRTAEAYRRQPDDEPAYFEPSAWLAASEAPRRSRRSPRASKRR